MNRKQRRARQATALPAAAPGARDRDLLRLAELCLRTGRLSEADTALRELLALHPAHPGAAPPRAALLRATGDPAGALALLRQAAARPDAVPDTFRELGAALAAANDLAGADRALSRALALDPDDPAAHAEHAAVLHRLGRLDAAAHAYAAASARRPDVAAWHGNHGIVLRELGRPAEALAAQERAVRLDPATPAIRFNLGNALRDAGRLPDAASAFRQALARQPDLHAARLNLGLALRALGRPAEAAAAFAAIPPHAPPAARADALRGLGELDAAANRPTAALSRFDQALALHPDDAVAHSNRGTALLELGRPAEADAAWSEAIRLRPLLADAWSNRQLGLHYHDTLPAEVGPVRARAFAARFASAPPSPFPNDPDPERPLRIGYVSADLGAHPVGRLLLPVLAAHDPTRVSVTGYDARPLHDDTAHALRAAATAFRPIAGLSDDALAALIRRDAIDVLVDLSGHTAGNRLTLFARRAAPVQCSWLGYWDTTGLSRIDAVLTDADTVPPGEEARYAEGAVIRLPHSRFRFAPPPDAPPVSASPAAGPGAVIFGCFNNLSKLTPAVLDCWSAILGAVPGSRLLLKWKTLAEPAACADLLARFAAAGLDPARIELRPASPYPAMLAEYAGLDLALDPFPFSGGASTLDALWMGVPVLTLPGAGAASRQTAGFLRLLDLPELICADPDDYVRRAAALAADPARRAALRATLRPRLTASPLSDARGLAAALEDAFRGLWRSRCAGSGRPAP